MQLGDLKTYAIEAASHNVSDAESDRHVLRWINRAMRAVRFAHPWQFFRKQGYVVVEPDVSGLNMSVTQGSTAVSLTGGETFAAKYVTTSEDWTLIAANDTTQPFRLTAITNSPTNTAGTLDHAWTAATATGMDYTWYRDRYALPDDCGRVLRVQDTTSRLELCYLAPADLDLRRQQSPSQTGATGWDYTIRADKIELWPLPTDYASVSLTYEREVTLYTSGTSNATELDWPDRWNDLLEAAVTVEASLTLGMDARVPYALAVDNYQRLLSRYRHEETTQIGAPSRMTLGREVTRWPMRNSLTDIDP